MHSTFNQYVYLKVTFREKMIAGIENISNTGRFRHSRRRIMTI